MTDKQLRYISGYTEKSIKRLENEFDNILLEVTEPNEKNN